MHRPIPDKLFELLGRTTKNEQDMRMEFIRLHDNKYYDNRIILYKHIDCTLKLMIIIKWFHQLNK